MAGQAQKNQFRAALCGHQALEASGVCLLLMVQGHLGAITLAHLFIAGKTGLPAVSPALALTFTRFARHFTNKWTAAVFFGMCTFCADALVHQSHYGGEYTEAALTAAGAFLLSIAVSYTPVGKYVDRLAETFLPHRQPAEG